MTGAPLDRLLETFTNSLFRLETLQVYAVPAYDERLRAFTEGCPLPSAPAKEEYLRSVREWTATGRRIHRVHVLDRPLTPYLRYELAVYEENAAAGEDIRLADRATHPDLAELRQDFLLVDGDTDHPAVMWYRYTDDGRFLRHEMGDAAADVDRCRRQRDLAIAHSILLDRQAVLT